jgi:hypothetical protein
VVWPKGQHPAIYLADAGAQLAFLGALTWTRPSKSAQR